MIRITEEKVNELYRVPRIQKLMKTLWSLTGRKDSFEDIIEEVSEHTHEIPNDILHYQIALEKYSISVIGENSYAKSEYDIICCMICKYLILRSKEALEDYKGVIIDGWIENNDEIEDEYNDLINFN